MVRLGKEELLVEKEEFEEVGEVVKRYHFTKPYFRWRGYSEINRKKLEEWMRERIRDYDWERKLTHKRYLRHNTKEEEMYLVRDSAGYKTPIFDNDYIVEVDIGVFDNYDENSFNNKYTKEKNNLNYKIRW